MCNFKGGLAQQRNRRLCRNGHFPDWLNRSQRAFPWNTAPTYLVRDNDYMDGASSMASLCSGPPYEAQNSLFFR
jgi:hypothetical protein